MKVTVLVCVPATALIGTHTLVTMALPLDVHSNTSVHTSSSRTLLRPTERWCLFPLPLNLGSPLGLLNKQCDRSDVSHKRLGCQDALSGGLSLVLSHHAAKKPKWGYMERNCSHPQRPPTSEFPAEVLDPTGWREAVPAMPSPSS